MALFKKETCSRCGKELGLIFGKVKVADGMLCKDCNALLSPLLSNKSKLTLAEIEKHINYRKANAIALKSFKATKILGNKTKFYFDEANSKFLVSKTTDYVAKNVDIIDLGHVTSAEVVQDVDEEEIFKTDAEGNEVAYEPARYNYKYSYKVNVTLNHVWIKNLTIDITDEAINSTNEVAVLAADNLANQIRAILLKKSFVPKTSLNATTTSSKVVTSRSAGSASTWTCSKCGTRNALTSKFCTNCGTAKTATNKFCSECGTKLETSVKFCPNCGKAVE